jgi:hypothetical protein
VLIFYPVRKPQPASLPSCPALGRDPLPAGRQGVGRQVCWGWWKSRKRDPLWANSKLPIFLFPANVLLEKMINKIAPKVNPALKRAAIWISIEIWPKIIYVDVIQFIFLLSDAPCQKPTLRK